MIIDGRVENCILLELFTYAGIGTEIVGRRPRVSQHDAPPLDEYGGR